MKENLILHTCCAPCLSQCLMVLTRNEPYEKILEEMPDFEIFIFFYNPNIFSYEEYLKRKNEVIRFIDIFNKEFKLNITIFSDRYMEERKKWYNVTEKYKNEPEKGLRCSLCYEFRLLETFNLAEKYKIKNIATTLTLSPLKNTKKINEIGTKLSNIFNIKYIKSDFKKNDGFKKSIELSRKYNLYRQDFCGCEWSNKKINHFDIL
ncbi:MAG: epoxyqueuosine reductase QueH [Brevinematales bacterium]|nr:epoxyqueuosine reductase QueH [Brevinematales bacterium]